MRVVFAAFGKRTKDTSGDRRRFARNVREFLVTTEVDAKEANIIVFVILVVI